MKENVFDVLIYLFENYMDDNLEAESDPDIIMTELIEAGFTQAKINQAFQWLESLTDLNTEKANPLQTETLSHRIFSAEEQIKLNRQCRGFLLFLEQNNILGSENRELVIDRVMALSEEAIDLEHLKWVVLMVLFSQPDQELAYAQMENLVYDTIPSILH
ncbi:MAG: DUF494 domain-containing protein [Methylococcales bacterium]